MLNKIINSCHRRVRERESVCVGKRAGKVRSESQQTEERWKETYDMCQAGKFWGNFLKTSGFMKTSSFRVWSKKLKFNP